MLLKECIECGEYTQRADVNGSSNAQFKCKHCGAVETVTIQELLEMIEDDEIYDE